MGTQVKIVIGVVVIVVLAVVAVALFAGGDDDGEPGSAGDGATQSDGKFGDAPGDAGDSNEPALRTIKVERAEGKTATANAGSLIRSPKQVWIRVSAAPKQEVRVTWLLACGGKESAQDNYVVTPPHLRQLKVPKGAKTCAASVAGQLVDGTGRLKVALLRDR